MSLWDMARELDEASNGSYEKELNRIIQDLTNENEKLRKCVNDFHDLIKMKDDVLEQYRRENSFLMEKLNETNAK